MRAFAASAVLSLTLSVAAWGWGGPLQSPMLPASAPGKLVTDAQFTKVFDYMTKELKFVEGSFINEYTSQSFTGSSEQVARFIELVKETGAWDLTVIFRDLNDPKAGLRIASGDHSGKLTIVVNLGREDFRLKDFGAFLPGQPVEK